MSGADDDDGRRPAPRPLATPRAVLFDVDFTLLEPGDMFEAEGYRRCAAGFGLELDVSKWETAEARAYTAVRERRRKHGNVHDEGIYSAIAEAIIVGLLPGDCAGGGDAGGDGDSRRDSSTVRACADAVIAAWTDYANFSLYDDARPCLAALRAAGMKLALVSNTSRSLDGVVAHFDLGDLIDATIASSEVGWFKPAPEIYEAALDALAVAAGEAVMVGDNPNDDVKGALAAGLAGAVLVDRKGHWEFDVPIVRSLAEVPPLLGV